MDITIAKFLQTAKADDYFFINVRRDKERLYLGYTEGVPQNIQALKIKNIYLDFASQAVGINVY
jgi:hypothetical protein